MAYALECSNLVKRFGQQVALQNVSLNAAHGQLIALLGPSGCGKTTTLRLIAGFEWPDDGTISIDGRVVAGNGVRIAPEDRSVGMVFQEYALFPHLDVNGNVTFGLRGNPREKQARADELLALVGLEGLGKRIPYELSGGQQQRVALARALAPRPAVLLLDEPFSNLDAALRVQVRSEVRVILKQAGTTCIFVTHDQEEALSLADEVAVMLKGCIAQMASPQALYHHPVSRDVADFVGEANFLTGEAYGEEARSPLGVIPLYEALHGTVDLLLRPEMLRLGTEGMPAQIEWREFYGHDQRIGVRLQDGTLLVARAETFDRYQPGQTVGVSVNAPVIAYRREPT